MVKKKKKIKEEKNLKSNARKRAIRKKVQNPYLYLSLLAPPFVTAPDVLQSMGFPFPSAF